MQQLFLEGRPIRVDPQKLIGSGGEADIYDIGRGRALKLFKPPTHPDFAANPREQEAARRRIEEHQQKLPAFPTGLPEGVITPQSLVLSQARRRIYGYVMRLVKDGTVLWKYSTRSFRESAVPDGDVLKIFQDLHRTVSAVHQKGVVIGDFNDLNVLVQGTRAYIVDADSFQFGPFRCLLFTDRFLDPLLCSPQGTLTLVRPYSVETDWYVYSALLMQSFLYVGPYGGVYRPAKGKGKGDAERRRSRITVFHPEVIYPKPARIPEILPDELLEHFHKVFEKDERRPFPEDLLSDLVFQECRGCGTRHARHACPRCARFQTPQIVTQISTQKVNGERMFRTSGVILAATVQSRTLRWAFHENGAFLRESGTPFTTGELRPHLQTLVAGERTVLAEGHRALIFTPGVSAPVALACESKGGTALIGATVSAF